MKRLIAVVIMLFVGAPLYAGDMVHLKSKAGDVTFDHKAHGEITECKTCHGSGTPGKIDLGGMELAHRLCGGCHTEKKMGPQANKCMECHKRSKQGVKSRWLYMSQHFDSKFKGLVASAHTLKQVCQKLG